MAQKKKTLSKKTNFFTKRKIALGVAIIALIGVGYILISNASGAGAETDPVQKKLFVIKVGAMKQTNQEQLRLTPKYL